MTPLDPSVALILLAAGRSERFGGDKLTASFQGKPLWEWAAQAAEDAGFVRRYLVVGGHSSVGSRRGWQRVLNADAEQGMGTSIAAGVAAAADHQRVVIALADMPNMRAGHLRRLAGSGGTVFTRQADGSAGTPAAFDKASFARLRSLDGERGARSLEFPDARIVEPDSKALLLDVDKPSDFPANN